MKTLNSPNENTNLIALTLQSLLLLFFPPCYLVELVKKVSWVLLSSVEIFERMIHFYLDELIYINLKNKLRRNISWSHRMSCSVLILYYKETKTS